VSCVLQLESAAEGDAEFGLGEIGWPKLVQGADVYAASDAIAVQSELLGWASSELLDTLQI
jgi:hypothetical protein